MRSPRCPESAARIDAAARLILRDPELARDAVQECLIRAWRDLPGLRDSDRFDAWLHRLLVNAAIDEARRRQRRVIEVALTDVTPAFDQDAFDLLADRDALDRAWPAWRPNIGRWSSCTTTSACRCRRPPIRSG